MVRHVDNPNSPKILLLQGIRRNRIEAKPTQVGGGVLQRACAIQVRDDQGRISLPVLVGNKLDEIVQEQVKNLLPSLF